MQMSRTRIKFCGITRAEDALAAARLGIDAIGFVLHADVPRRIELDVARKILAILPPFVTPVGLFVDAPPDLLRKIISDLHLRHVQLHGRETPEDIASLKNLAIVKAIHVSRENFSDELKIWQAAIEKYQLTNLKALLLETAGANQNGGTGAVNDWEFIRERQSAGDFVGLPPIIAAGGLRPENVGQVVQNLRPFAVDVSSGIESTRGIKSKEKMIAFIQAVRAADETASA
jgi:phosphoribosylanthranilate isomerase